ncbi:gluconate periplasmic binding protein [Erwinia amylovora MR1]|nr:gluconate periplasmic binding protein [Erwinia amylovora MR1]
MLPIPPGCWLCAMPLAFAIHGLCSVCLRQLLVHPAAARAVVYRPGAARINAAAACAVRRHGSG